MKAVCAGKSIRIVEPRADLYSTQAWFPRFIAATVGKRPGDALDPYVIVTLEGTCSLFVLVCGQEKADLHIYPFNFASGGISGGLHQKFTPPTF
jgi:hypothetical protein